MLVDGMHATRIYSSANATRLCCLSGSIAGRGAVLRIERTGEAMARQTDISGRRAYPCEGGPQNVAEAALVTPPHVG
jgi:hypothetical protein